jgi:hypothetical protein
MSHLVSLLLLHQHGIMSIWFDWQRRLEAHLCLLMLEQVPRVLYQKQIVILGRKLNLVTIVNII